MAVASSGGSIPLWFGFALMTVASWGLYGVLLHTGQVAMGDLENGRYKAFLWVGIAYILVAVIGPIIMLKLGDTDWSMPSKGVAWSLLAGVMGALGAFGVLLAFGAKGNPAVVMSIVFAGAPIVNAVTVFAIHPPAKGLASLDWRFIAGMALAIVGATMVTLYKPKQPASGPAKPAPESEAPAEGSQP